MSRSEHQLSTTQCSEMLKRALQSDQVTLIDFELKTVKDNLGFMGEHLILHVKYQHEELQKQTTFFMKRTPSNERHFNYVVGEGLFAKEKEMYEILLPIMCKHLNIPKLPVPDCYLINDNNYMVFEDLTTLGFNLHDKLIPLNVEYCKIGLKTIAKFHAGSIALELKTGEPLSKIIKHNFEVFLVGENHKSIAHIWHKASIGTTFGFLKKVNKYKERLNGNWEVVHKKLKEAWNQSVEFANNPSDKFRNILCHGDLWSNNILFKLDEDGKPCDAALVDFQLFRYVPPAMDIVMFLHATTTRDFRERHILELLMTYQVALKDALNIAGLENHALSLQELLQSVHEYRLFGVVVAARYLPTCLKQSEEIEEVKQRLANTVTLAQDFLLDNSDRLVKSLETSPARRARVMQAVDELLDWLHL